MALTPVLRRLRGRRVVLASASPRRRDILSYTGLRFEVVPSRFAETLDKATFPTPHDYAQETARQKALEVAQRLREKDQRTPDIVIGADTVVAVAGLILEKPRDKEDAFRMLRRLSGQEHSVITGVAIVRFPRCDPGAPPPDPEVTSFHEETRVTFSVLTDELLQDYVDSGEPMDKAGGYALQALGAMLVERAEGDFLSAVGFPLNRFCRELQAVLGPEVTPPSPSCGGADHGDGCVSVIPWSLPFLSSPAVSHPRSHLFPSSLAVYHPHVSPLPVPSSVSHHMSHPFLSSLAVSHPQSRLYLFSLAVSQPCVPPPTFCCQSIPSPGPTPLWLSITSLPLPLSRPRPLPATENPGIDL